jgi:hypothetical protein
VAGFKKVIEREPDNAAGYDNLGVVLMRMECWNAPSSDFSVSIEYP